jgi:hypothetical protein
MATIKIVAVIAACVALAPANAKEKNLLIMGHGTATCAQFAAVYDDPIMEDAFFDWGQGFLSAMNVSLVGTGSKTTKNLASSAIETQKLAIRKFCDQHPSQRYSDAVMNLFNSLKEEPLNPDDK